MELRNYKPLALLAADEEDLNVLSAVLQDAVGKLGDFAWQKEQRRFAFVVNRFIWEVNGKKKFGPFHRVRAGVHFDDVLSVRAKNVRLDAKSAVVTVLSVSFEAQADGQGLIKLVLGGGGEIELRVESINASIRDLTTPWATRNKPDHEA